MAIFRPEEENSVYIGEGAELSGTIRARDSIVIDGVFDGEIICNHLLVGPGGEVKGKLAVASADISGRVAAEIVVKSLMTVRVGGRVEGKWECGAIEVARGAILNGSASVVETAGAQRREALVEQARDAGERPLRAIAPPEPRRLTRLNLRAPRRSEG